jgi:hypothetical protein
LPCPVPCAKIFCFSETANHPTSLPSRPTQRGVSRSSRTLERDAMDAAVSGRAHGGRAGYGLSQTRERPDGEQDGRHCSVRSSRVVLTPQRSASSLAEVWKVQPGRHAIFRKATEARKPDTPGRARSKLLKPLRAGMPGCPGKPVVTTLVRLSTPVLPARLRGHRHPAFPTPSVGRRINA